MFRVYIRISTRIAKVMIVGQNFLMNCEEVILSFQKANKVPQSGLDNLV
jgi:hypothetical protein